LLLGVDDLLFKVVTLLLELHFLDDLHGLSLHLLLLHLNYLLFGGFGVGKRLLELFVDLVLLGISRF